MKVTREIVEKFCANCLNPCDFMLDIVFLEGFCGEYDITTDEDYERDFEDCPYMLEIVMILGADT